ISRMGGRPGKVRKRCSALLEVRNHDTVIALEKPRGDVADAEPAFLRRRKLNSGFMIEASHADFGGFGTLRMVKHFAQHTPSVRVRKSRIKIVVNPQASFLVETVDIDDNVERLADGHKICEDLIWLGLLVRGKSEIQDDRLAP